MNYDYMIEEEKLNAKEMFAPIFKFLLKIFIGTIVICGLGYLLQNIVGIDGTIIKGIIIFIVAIGFLVLIMEGNKLKNRSLTVGLLFDAYNLIKKERYKRAENILDNSFMVSLNKAYKEPIKNESEKNLKKRLYIRYMELKTFILFNNFIEKGEEDIKQELIIALDNIIKKASEVNLNEKVACAYANKAIVNLFIYEVRGLNDYKIVAKEDYNKSIEYMTNKNIKQKLENRFKNIA